MPKPETITDISEISPEDNQKLKESPELKKILLVQNDKYMDQDKHDHKK